MEVSIDENTWSSSYFFVRFLSFYKTFCFVLFISTFYFVLLINIALYQHFLFGVLYQHFLFHINCHFFTFGVLYQNVLFRVLQQHYFFDIRCINTLLVLFKHLKVWTYCLSSIYFQVYQKTLITSIFSYNIIQNVTIK